MTATTADIEEAITEHPVEAEDALAAVQLGFVQPLTVDVLRLMAPKAKMTVAELWVDQLGKLKLLEAFAQALNARGVALDVRIPEVIDDRLDLAKLERFVPMASAFRCRVLVNKQVVGSGCLIGPSLVLTAWHVIALGPPNGPQQPAPNIEVLLGDGQRLVATVPPMFESFCGDDEYRGTAPKADTDVEGRKDVALLAMDRPAAAHLQFAPLPAAAPEVPKGLMLLFDYPKGQDTGVGVGTAAKMPGVTSRWRHTISTDVGSSGGACFNGDFELIGVHQAKWGTRRRLVPLRVFHDDIRAMVEEDRAPVSLWALDRSADAPFVIGRDQFFQGVAAAGRPVTRIRGVRIKRTDVQSGPTGLAFSHDLLAHLLTRRGIGHALVRITFEDRIVDLDQHIRQRMEAAGIELEPAPSGAGVQPGQAALEAVAKERSRVLAAAMDAAAHKRDLILWLFIDTPSVTMTESARLFLEGFVTAALVRHQLRLVIAGFETMLLAGEEFATVRAADGDGPPGFVVEYLGGFTEVDVRGFLATASTDLLGAPDPGVEAAARQSLQGLSDFNTVYRDADLPIVADRLRPTIRDYIDRAGGG